MCLSPADRQCGDHSLEKQTSFLAEALERQRLHGPTQESMAEQGAVDEPPFPHPDGRPRTLGLVLSSAFSIQHIV